MELGFVFFCGGGCYGVFDRPGFFKHYFPKQMNRVI